MTPKTIGKKCHQHYKWIPKFIHTVLMLFIILPIKLSIPLPEIKINKHLKNHSNNPTSIINNPHYFNNCI